MAKSDITGKRKLLAQNVSHSNIKTKRWQHINVQSRRLWVPELGKFVRLNVTTRDMRTIDKIGLVAYAKRHGVELLGSKLGSDSGSPPSGADPFRAFVVRVGSPA